MSAIFETHFQLKALQRFYRGKVRDVYELPEYIIMVASDRVSAFDTILPQAIPGKGQVLNQTSAFFMDLTHNQVPNWVYQVPDPNVTIGWKCEPFKIEMVMRGHIAGSAWRAYRAGKRVFNGYTLPEGLAENDRLPEAIITPSTKAEQGQHDEEISFPEILAAGLASKEQLDQLIEYSSFLFNEGRKLAESKGMLLVDTKYEFGIRDGKIYLIDEIHTPDSSRYFDAQGFDEKQARGERQTHRSKEMLRQWLIQNGFQGQAGEAIPPMDESFINAISEEYQSVYEQLSGKSFLLEPIQDRLQVMENRIINALEN